MPIIAKAMARQCHVVTLSFLLTLAYASSTSFAPDDPALYYIGRFDHSDPKRPAFQWPMTSIATQTQCKEASHVELQLETSDWYTSFAAYIGGRQVAREFFRKGKHNFSVPLPAGTSVLTVENDCEAFSVNPAMFPQVAGQKVETEPVYFTRMTFSSPCSFTQPPKKQRRMEVIGDSISCGFGNTNKPDSCKNEKGWTSCIKEFGEAMLPLAHNKDLLVYNVSSSHKSYASQLARMFDAELHLQCISGIGMCKNANHYLGPSSEKNMSFFVDRTLPYKQDSNGPVMWDYSQWQPDLLLINLGTNDYDTSGGPTAPTQEAFYNQYAKFAMHFMKYYEKSQTKVILACGPMTNKQCSNVQKVADTLKKTYGISAAYADASVSGTPDELEGIVDHPSEEEDAQMVEKLRPVVESLTGWTVSSPQVESILV